MFEKEAEEYLGNFADCANCKERWSVCADSLDEYCLANGCCYATPKEQDIYIVGAEFGYNKALEEATHNYNAIIADYDKRIAELEKENADLEIYNEELLDDDIEKHSKIVELQAQIGKMKCCQNCKHCTEIKNYKALGGKEISKVCSDGNYVCDKWEIKEK